MNNKQIMELVKIMDSANLKYLEVCEGETKIRLEKNVGEVIAVPAGIAIPASKTETASKTDAAVIDFNNLNEVRSPLVGVFYAAPSPDSAPFVKIGQKVKAGEVLCIVEAMKQMNEITAETDGEIADICVKNGDIIEYNQVLFKIF